jgi:hypothetical protein
MAPWLLPATNDLMARWMRVFAHELDRWAAEMDECADFLKAGFEPGIYGRAETHYPFNTCTCTKLRRRPLGFGECRCPLRIGERSRPDRAATCKQPHEATAPSVTLLKKA